MYLRRLCTLLVVLISMTYAAHAQQPPDQRIGLPVYDPVSKRYFALMRADPANWGTMWGAVARQAERQTYKGVRGRLAIVDSVDVHEFLLRTFHPNQYQYVWIGLRYLCGPKKLEWSDGRMLQPGSFQAWDPNWKQDIYACNSNPGDRTEWAPVAYSPQFKWIVKGLHKGYDWYFIEFPTGQP